MMWHPRSRYKSKKNQKKEGKKEKWRRVIEDRERRRKMEITHSHALASLVNKWQTWNKNFPTDAENLDKILTERPSCKFPTSTIMGLKISNLSIIFFQNENVFLKFCILGQKLSDKKTNFPTIFCWGEWREGAIAFLFFHPFSHSTLLPSGKDAAAHPLISA